MANYIAFKLQSPYTSTDYGFLSKDITNLKGSDIIVRATARTSGTTHYPMLFLYAADWSWGIATGIDFNSATDITREYVWNVPTAYSGAYYLTWYYYPNDSTRTTDGNCVISSYSFGKKYINSADYITLKGKIDTARASIALSSFSWPTEPTADTIISQTHIQSLIDASSSLVSYGGSNLFARIGSATSVGSKVMADHLIELEQIIDDRNAGARCSGCSSGCARSCSANCYTTCSSATCATNCTGVDCKNACSVACNNACTTRVCDEVCTTNCNTTCSGCINSCVNGCITHCNSCASLCDGCGTTCFGSFASFCGNVCSGGCDAGCKGGCNGSCVGGCSGCIGCSSKCTDSGCTGVCTGGCNTTCKTDCTGGCNTGCSGSCRSGCGSMCYTGCEASCHADCYTNCIASCYNSCSSSCYSGCSATSRVGTDPGAY